jgi:tetratricopeptide (TPR) repeat protein
MGNLDHALTLRRLGIVTAILVASLVTVPDLQAIPRLQTDSVAQCAEGIQRIQEGRTSEALTLLEAGFAARHQATFAKADDLGKCAIALGVLQNAQGNYDRALEAYTVALEVFRQSANKSSEGAALLGLGKLHRSRNLYGEALATFEQALAIWRAEGNRAAEGVTLDDMGAIYRAQQRYGEALATFEQALAIWRAEGKRKDELTTLTNIGLVYTSQNQYEAAQEQFQQALTIAREDGDRASEAVVLRSIGLMYGSQGQYEVGLEQLQQALTIMQEIGNPAGVGAVLIDIGLSHGSRERNEEALAAFEQALSIARERGDHAGEGTIYSNIGLIYFAQKRHTQALAALEQALAIAREGGNRAAESTALGHIGQVYWDQDRYQEALATLEQALAIDRERHDRDGEGSKLRSIGMIRRSQGRYQEALAALEQALTIARERHNRTDEASTLVQIAGTYVKQGRYTDALEHFEQALTIAREVGDRAEETGAIGNIGLVYTIQGRYGEALSAYEQALAIAREAGNRDNEGAVLVNIGLVYHEQGRIAEALEYLEQALALARERQDRADEGTIHTGIGQVYVAQSRYKEALDAFEQALVIARDIGDREGYSNALGNLGDVFFDLDMHDDALKVYQEALAIKRALGDRRGESVTLDHIGRVYKDQQLHQEALTVFEQALAIDREIGHRAGESTTLDQVGQIYAEQQRHADALEHFEQAIRILDDIRANAGNETNRISFIAQHTGLYNRAVRLAHQQGQDDRAYLLSEQGRARTFLDSLATGQVQLDNAGAQKLVIAEQEAFTVRLAAQEALARARAVNPPDAFLVADLERQLTAAEQAHTAALAAIEQHDSQLAALIPSRTQGVLDRASVQQHLDSQTTLIEYHVLADQTLAFVFTRDSFVVVELAPNQTELRNNISTLRQFANLSDAHPASAMQLYEWLIAPLQAQKLLTTAHLAIVPHRVLHYLPFAALSDGNRYLIDEYVLTVLPNASSLPFIQANANHTLGAPLIVGNPATDDPTLRPLQYAEREAKTIAQLYGGNPLLGTAATESAVREHASQAGIVHLAAHGRYKTDEPLASSITLASSGDDDGQLEVREVYGLKLPAAGLVVLSACETQINELNERDIVTAGDEVVGLTRALFFAGTPSVIATLWSVDDAASALLMERFYIHLRAGSDKAEALRQAQQDVRKQYPHPYYWSGFVLSGDRGTSSRETAWPWIGIGSVTVLLSLLAGAVLVYRRRVLARSTNHAQMYAHTEPSTTSMNRIPKMEDDTLLRSLLVERSDSTPEIEDDALLRSLLATLAHDAQSEQPSKKASSEN